MIDLIKKLFQEKGFSKYEDETFTLFRPNESEKKYFWLIVETDNLDEILEKQSEWSLKGKEITENDPAFDKNASLLVLFNIEELSEKEKTKILKIEENPYDFKKYVLQYSEEEVDSLNEELSTDNIASSLEDLIASDAVFGEYKEKFNSKGWQTLVYRITHKIPFIDIDIGEAKDIASLKNNINNKVQEKGLQEFHERINALKQKHDLSAIKDMENDRFIRLLKNNDHE